MKRAVVAGAGIFGVTAALELRARGWDVTLVDPGPLPHPLAESTDISKVIRADYGKDALYTGLMERAFAGWHDWNAGPCAGLYHPTGVMFVCRRPMAEGGFEHDSFQMLSGRGHRLERLEGAELRARFPMFGPAYVDGYANPLGGYAESGAVVTALVKLAADRGVVVRERVEITGDVASNGRVTHVTTRGGDRIAADLVVYALGAWVPHVLPTLAGAFRSTGHPVLHLTPPDDTFREPTFRVFGADISETGLYGFPTHPKSGVLKAASHSRGRVVHPGDEIARAMRPEEEDEVRRPLREAFPALGDAPIVSTRICVYGDTHDGDLWVAPDPEVPTRVVATGGSGHAFKFAPLLGALIADACEGSVEPRFRWRPEVTSARPADAARHV
ncbi:MAG: FAD-dependent oxidoreductase [Polyangiaceae bacterium]